MRKDLLMSEKKMVSTGQISKVLGFTVSKKYIEELGFPPVISTATGHYWRQSLVPIICLKISIDVTTKGLNFINDNYSKNEGE